jgi:hypothetical protein
MTREERLKPFYKTPPKEKRVAIAKKANAARKYDERRRPQDYVIVPFPALAAALEFLEMWRAEA